MKLVQLAGLYFLGTEDFNSSNCMMATVVLKEKIDVAKLFPCYRELIMDHPLLQTKIMERPEKNKFDWGRFSSAEIEHLLNFERKQLAGKHDMDTVLQQYYPTNSRLPFTISMVDEYRVVVCMNHIIANGRGFIFWIQKWLQYYSGERNALNPVRQTGRTFGRTVLRLLKRAGAFLWLPVFLGQFILLAGRTAAQDTVDLSCGKRPQPNGDYAIKSYSFSREDTQRILQKCKQTGMTLTEFMCGILTKSLLASDPTKSRVFISMPMDIQDLLPYSPEDTCGNFIASLPAQFFQGAALEAQVKAVCRWFKRGIPYSLSCLFACFSPSYKNAKLTCLELCKKPIPERSPLWNFSLTYSSLGIIADPLMEKLVESIFFFFKSQSVLLASATLSGRLFMELSSSKDLYDTAEVFDLFDKILSVEHLLNAK